MRLAALLRDFRDWRERRAAEAELRRFKRIDAPYEREDANKLIDAVHNAAISENPEATLQAFARLRALAPEFAITSKVAIRALMNVREVDTADAALADGLQKYPDNRDLLLLYVEMPFLKRDWPELVRRSEIVRRKLPNHITAYNWGAVALKALNRLDEAGQLLKRALAIRPDDPFALGQNAYLAQQLGDREEELRRWEVMAERVNTIAGTLGAARCLSVMGRYDEAIERLEAARWKYQTTPDPLVEIARVFRQREDLESSARYWHIVRELFPQTKEGFIEGARILRELGQTEEADRILQVYADHQAAQTKGEVES